MDNYTHKKQLFVVYDGIENSVFQSQVLQPLIKELELSPTLEITLISFESKKLKNSKLLKLIPAHDRLNIILCRKISFIGKVSLWFAAYQLMRILKQIDFTQITARGPLAAYVLLTALSWAHVSSESHLGLSIIVQARGLCAQEYRYTYQHEKPHFWRTWWRHFVYNRLQAIECYVYGGKQKDLSKDLVIESVSPALKDYLMTTFNADPMSIVIAVKDIPERCTVEQVSSWRQDVRQELKIPVDSLVYCYSGSWRPWQCADKTIEYFIGVAAQSQQAHLLILTNDREKFIKELKAYRINPQQYTIFSAPPVQLLRYLAAADFGMLFREQDIINWVSRPTKMLEYQSVGLQIIHNNTVGMLAAKK
ncbi:hypothetical protein JST56_04955 [Candidatus Dependentiae bacterium]|jgi:hypothetical protein|nr:hypothetical protein [Candidatus Dependentiae bacterium]